MTESTPTATDPVTSAEAETEAGAGTSPRPDQRRPRRVNAGAGRVLVWIYGLFALSATARASVQIATEFHQARISYTLSAVSGVIYILATVFLARSTARSRVLAIACCSVELAGVITVGAASLIWRSAFPDASVWSGFGQGYGYVPLILPILGLWWLLRRPA